MKKILGLLVALMASVSMFAKTYQQDIVSAYDTVVFDWANNIGSITYEGSVEEKTVYTQTNTISTACIAISYSYLSKGTYSYAELSVADGFKTGDVVDIDFCYSNSAEKQTRVAMYDVNDNKLAESDLAINARLQDGMSNFQYQLTSDMASIRVARSGGSTIYITRLQVIRTEPTYNVTANAIPSYAGTVDVTYNEDHTQATLTATPNDGYHFAGWSDGITINPRTIILTSDLSLSANFAQSGSSTNYVLDFTTQGTSISDWIINYATLNESNTNEDAGKYVYDIQGGIESESYVASRPNIVFKVKNASDKQKAFVVYPGQCYEFGGKNGILEIKGTSTGDTITLLCAAKSSITDANFLDGSGVYPINANAITEDLIFPHKDAGAYEADEQGYTWKEIQYVSLGGDVEIKEFAGGFRVKRVEVGEHKTTPALPNKYWYWKGYVDGVDIENVQEGNSNVFQNGISSITVQQDAYLFVVYQEIGVAGVQYMSQSYVYGPTHATMTTTGIEKIHIPAGTWTLYLYDNGDGTVELAYQPMAGKTLVNDVLTEYYTVTANASPSYAGTVDMTYSADHTQATLTAIANDGYRFTRWNDGNRQNPRTMAVTQDTTITAYFEQDYTMPEIDHCDWFWKGWFAEGYETATPTDENFFQNGISQITVRSAAYLYLLRCVPGERVGVEYMSREYSENTHVTMYNVNSIGYGGNKLYIPAGVWTLYLYNNGDGTVELSREPLPGKTLVGGGITPYFEISTSVYPANTGTVEVVYSDDHSMATLTAIGSNGYHFMRWNGGNTENPRTVMLTQDTTFMAMFEHDMLEVTYIGMGGKILGVEDVPYGSTAHRVGIDADEFGYTLTGWDKDLNHVTENLTVTAIYKRDAVNGFYYIYDKENRTAVLDREENSYANIRTLNVPNNFIYRGIKFAVVAVGANAFENCDRLTDVVLPGNVENVEEYAFSGCSDMIHLTMSANLRGIADYAFNGCKRLEDITVYAQRVPDLTATSFNAIGNKKYVNVYVPDNRVNNYKRDEYWSEFNIVVKSADAIEGEVSDVTVEPEETTAQFTWPTDNSAGSYTIEITKDGVVFCTLIFNANGQLTGIAFAPGRNGNEAPMAAMTANGGMQFTVTGLDAGTSYAYTVTTKDKQDKVIATFEGSFETSGSMEDGIMDVQSGAAPQKVLHNGQIYILRGEKMFTLQGVEVK